MITMRTLTCILFLALGSTNNALSEEDLQPDSRIALVPHGLLFRPLLANTYEPRVGLLSQLGKNQLRLDIGNSIDLLEYDVIKDSSSFSMGADFFTYTLLRSERNFHFPVDASDYFFGVNFNYKSSTAFGLMSSRLRISHISAHFVDGHYDNTKGEWKDSRYPIVYSREFIDVVFACEPAPLNDALRGYFGATYLFHVDPITMDPFTAYAGLEWHSKVYKATSFYAGYQTTVMNISEVAFRQNVQLGAKFGEWNGRGLNLFASYFSGFSVHGEYFDVKENYFGLGFLIEF
jgi:Protein of unknown function (DUF1207)